MNWKKSTKASEMQFYVKRTDHGFEVLDTAGRSHGIQQSSNEARKLLTIVRNMFLASYGGQLGE